MEKIKEGVHSLENFLKSLELYTFILIVFELCNRFT